VAYQKDLAIFFLPHSERISSMSTFGFWLAISLAAGDAPLADRLGPALAREAGIEKLSAEEQQVLLRWMDAQQCVVAEKGSPPTSTTRAIVESAPSPQATTSAPQNQPRWPPRAKDGPIEARIVGEFRGFLNGRTFVLDNGQRWRQFDTLNWSFERSNPKVRIRPGVLGSWRMRVEGENRQVSVRPVED
jgi:hypothetical protein